MVVYAITVISEEKIAAILPYLNSNISGTVTFSMFLILFAIKYISAIPSQAPPLDHKLANPLRYPSPAPLNSEPLPIHVANNVPTSMYQGKVRPASMKSLLFFTDRTLYNPTSNNRIK